MKRVLVLGATGYVGSRVVEALRRTEWASPVAAVRPKTAQRAVLPSVEIRTYEATNPSALKGALDDVDCVVNCVAGDSKAMVMSAQHLFATALTSPVERIVHISSMVVYGGATGLVNEQSPITADGGHYARAKFAAEQLARDFSQRGGNVVVLRPSCIYGPGSEQWTGRIGRLLRAGRIGDLGPAGDGCCNLVYIDDIVSAVLEALRRPGLDGEVFNVSSPNPETWNNYFVRFGRALGATPIRRISSRRFNLETKLIAPALKGLELLSRRFGTAVHLPDAIPPSLARLWRQDIRLAHRKSDALLCFSRTPLTDGIAAAARWLAP